MSMKRKVKITLLKVITVMAFIGWAVTACAMDSENINGLLAVNLICMAWLFLMALANGKVII